MDQTPPVPAGPPIAAPPPTTSASSPPTPPEPMSLFSRLLNVFAAPGEAFADLKDKPVATPNWLVPALLIMCVGWFASVLVFSQDNLKHQMKEMREKAIQKQMEKQHKSQEEIDKIIEATDKFGNIPAIAGGVFGPIFFAWWPPFVWGFIFWLIATKALGAQLPYMKAVEAVGLAAMIDVLDGIVRALLIIAMGNLFASPSLALLVKNFDPTNPMHVLLSYLNIMTFWLLAVRAVGLARLANVSFARAAAWVFGFWFATSALIYGVSTGIQQVFSKMGGAGGGGG